MPESDETGPTIVDTRKGWWWFCLICQEGGNERTYEQVKTVGVSHENEMHDGMAQTKYGRIRTNA